jgi:hypothetical protein
MAVAMDKDKHNSVLLKSVRLLNTIEEIEALSHVYLNNYNRQFRCQKMSRVDCDVITNLIHLVCCLNQASFNSKINFNLYVAINFLFNLHAFDKIIKQIFHYLNIIIII